ncbi:MAG: hypothetical protein M1831_004652 [Alyxoria varia]|nr:MAG: hypothetical protein M1831_004652 [Alyxoria varia]
MRYQVLALFAAGAAFAAPVAQQYGGQQDGGQDWQKVWQDQLASMKQVQDGMGKHEPTPAPQPKQYEQPKQGETPANPEPVPPPKPDSESSTYPDSPTEGGEESSSPPAPDSEDNSAPSSGGGNGQKVSSSKAFASGAGCKSQELSGPKAHDGYKCYGNTADTMPSKDKWASWDSLWEGNQKLLKTACTNLGQGADNSEEQNKMIGEAIQKVAKETMVDARFILAIVMQESHGCLNVGATNNGVNNPGLMQSHNGESFCGASKSPAEQKKSIEQMIRDGVQGTSDGEGLLQGIDKYGDIYAAARKYNSGSCDPSNLNNAFSSTKSYVQSIANRMTGYVMSPMQEPTC